MSKRRKYSCRAANVDASCRAARKTACECERLEETEEKAVP